jgi:hypothetical protein
MLAHCRGELKKVFFKVFEINQIYEKASKSGFLMIGYYRVCSLIVAACSLLHFLPAAASHSTVIGLEFSKSPFHNPHSH